MQARCSAKTIWHVRHMQCTPQPDPMPCSMWHMRLVWNRLYVAQGWSLHGLHAACGASLGYKKTYLLTYLHACLHIFQCTIIFQQIL